jgi:hypothetical protein
MTEAMRREVWMLLHALIATGVEVYPKRQKEDYGSFGRFTGSGGNRVELWLSE